MRQYAGTQPCIDRTERKTILEKDIKKLQTEVEELPRGMVLLQ